MPTQHGSKPRDTSIETYQARRDFSRTAEPPPGQAAGRAEQPIFVIQKHDATRLHWDFRLEHGGVLWSWAVPRGPSLDPHDKRLAVHVEDHPLDYADFHGTIPEGQYGAGTVELWDRGTWQPVGPDPAAAMAGGELKFVLHGTRLHGRFVLIRLKPRPRERAENWLLIKEHDEHERAGIGAGEIEAERRPPRPRRRAGVWNSKAAHDDTGPDPVAKGDQPPAAGAIRGSFPEQQTPQLAELAEAAPLGRDWVSEIKFDGYRLLAFVENGDVRLVTRNGHDWTHRMKRLAQSVASLGLRHAVLDGEMVALDADGRSSFSLLQAALADGRDRDLLLYLFDLLHLDGWDLRPCGLLDRKQVLHALSDWRGAVRFSDHMEGQAAALHQQACARHLEGIICKRADAPYRAGRGHDWVKVKCQGREEFVILGHTPPQGSRTGFGALHLGYHDPAGTCTTPAASAPGSPIACWRSCARSWTRSPASARRAWSGRATSRTAPSAGYARSWWPRCSTSPGPATDGCATRASWACATTSRPRTSCANRRTSSPPTCRPRRRPRPRPRNRAPPSRWRSGRRRRSRQWAACA